MSVPSSQACYRCGSTGLFRYFYAGVWLCEPGHGCRSSEPEWSPRVREAAHTQGAVEWSRQTKPTDRSGRPA